METDSKNAGSRIAELEKEIAELKARIPQHSVRPAMIIELEDLEDELAAKLAALAARQAQGFQSHS